MINVWPGRVKLVFCIALIAFTVAFPKDQTQKRGPEEETANFVAYQAFEVAARTASTPGIETCFPEQIDRVRRLKESLIPVEGKTVADYPGLAGQPAWFINAEGQLQYCDLGRLRPWDKVTDESPYEPVGAVNGVKSVKLIAIGTSPRTFVLYQTQTRPYPGRTTAAGPTGPPFS